MYSLSGRLNTIAFNTLMFLAALSAMNYLSCYPFTFLGGYDVRKPTITKAFEVKNIDTFLADRYYNEDCMSFTFDFEADLNPLFNWNTNLIFAYITCEYTTGKSKFNRITIWDQRIMRQGQHAYNTISLKNEYPEYYLTDYNKQMRDVDVTCHLNWEQMPIVGANYGSRIEIGTFRTPKNYITNSKRKYAPGPEQRELNY